SQVDDTAAEEADEQLQGEGDGAYYVRLRGPLQHGVGEAVDDVVTVVQPTEGDRGDEVGDQLLVAVAGQLRGAVTGEDRAPQHGVHHKWEQCRQDRVHEEQAAIGDDHLGLAPEERPGVPQHPPRPAPTLACLSGPRRNAHGAASLKCSRRPSSKEVAATSSCNPRSATSRERMCRITSACSEEATVTVTLDRSSEVFTWRVAVHDRSSPSVASSASVRGSSSDLTVTRIVSSSARRTSSTPPWRTIRPPSSNAIRSQLAVTSPVSWLVSRTAAPMERAVSRR